MSGTLTFRPEVSTLKFFMMLLEGKPEGDNVTYLCFSKFSVSKVWSLNEIVQKNGSEEIRCLGPAESILSNSMHASAYLDPKLTIYDTVITLPLSAKGALAIAMPLLELVRFHEQLEV